MRLRVLMVEDSEDDAELIRLELSRAGFEIEWRRVETAETFVEALTESWDLIICDFQMPRFNGLRAFSLFKESGVDVPFIFVSGALGEERAVEAMRAGARDYLLKGNLARLDAAVRRELTEASNRGAQRRAEVTAEREQQRLTAAVEASGTGIFEYQIPPAPDFHVSERCLEIMGRAREDVPEHGALFDWFYEMIHPDDAPLARAAHDAFVRGASPRLAIELRIESQPGGADWTEVALFGKAERAGHALRVVGVLLDLSERRSLEAQLRQAQKMEAIGQLAGGVAHDFNNLLTAIFTFGRFVLDDIDPEQPSYEDMQEVLRAAERASELTSQLLAFSRLKPITPRVMNLNGVVRDIDRMLRRLVGEHIDVSTALAPDLGNVRIDRGSLEQVLMNLVINARDAMRGGGKLSIETENVELDASYPLSHAGEGAAGDYVVVAVSDTGTGMDEATRARIFEPFFTTKGQGEGTGLGLSTCYGIIKQAGGAIWVYSELGRGTTFKVYLPRIHAEEESAPRSLMPTRVDGTETILVAEDDPQVRKLIKKTLCRLGYRVLTASTGEDAVQLSERTTERVALLLTDVVMPGMSGKELAARLGQERPGVKVLYMSGYTPHAVAQHGLLDQEIPLVQKPFTPKTLAQRVREALDG